jgi:hypothetical protein
VKSLLLVFLKNITEGYEAPSWYTPERMEMMKEISDYSMTQLFNGTKKNRLTAGMEEGGGGVSLAW